MIMKKIILKLAGPAVFILNLAWTIHLWTLGSLTGLRAGRLSSYFIIIGTLTGLLAFYFILWQLLLIARIAPLERAWGHDKLSRFHHFLGVASAAILLLHPIFLALGYSQAAQTSALGQFWEFLTSYEDVLSAFAAYLMLLGITLISLYSIKKRFRYEIWYALHVTLYIAVIISFEHQTALGRDFAGTSAVIYWNTLLYATLLAVFYYRLAKPFMNFRKFGFRVAEVRSETKNVWSVSIEGKNIHNLKFKSGQFVIARFLAPGFWMEAHPFSLSEAPNGKRLRLTIKESGDFTKKISKLPLGAKVFLEGPMGLLTVERAKKEKVLLIAGGIGVTPLRALFEEFSKTGKQAALIYAARSEEDFALKTEINSLCTNTCVAHYVPENTQGKLTPEFIKEKIPDVAERFAYLCGPPPMMKAARGMLLKLGVPNHHILYEKFSLG